VIEGDAKVVRERCLDHIPSEIARLSQMRELGVIAPRLDR